MAFLLFAVAAHCLHGGIFSQRIIVPECEKPDYPLYGGYRPNRDFYEVGDIIHYHCDTDTLMSGNFQRVCEDTGDWSGDTPVCDAPMEFLAVGSYDWKSNCSRSDASIVTDGIRSTCLESTNIILTFSPRTEVIQIMVFLQKGEVNYEVFLYTNNDDILSCGKKEGEIDALAWEYHKCPTSESRYISLMDIVSRARPPMHVCEVVVQGFVGPVCSDPHFKIANGRLKISRKIAELQCDSGFIRSPDTRLECIRTGVWTRKTLYCLPREK